MKPFFTIGVTTYRRPDFLRECIRSILEQKEGNFEVLIGNDYPPEQITAASLGISDPRVRIINRETNLGELRNMNALLAEAKGEYFTWLADDDLYAPGFLNSVRQAFEENGTAACTFTGYTMKQNALDLRPLAKVRSLAGREFLRQYMRREIPALGCYGIWRTEVLRRLGGMQQLGSGFSPGSDGLLAIRAGLFDQVLYIDAPLLLFREHDDSISNSSPDLKAYETAQEAICQECLGIFRTPTVSEDFDANFYEILSFWCIEHYYSVLGRSPSLELQNWPNYARLITRFASELSNVSRARLLGKAVYDLRLIARARTARGIRKLGSYARTP